MAGLPTSGFCEDKTPVESLVFTLCLPIKHVDYQMELANRLIGLLAVAAT
jgi:hypothetical protein